MTKPIRWLTAAAVFLCGAAPAGAQSAPTALRQRMDGLVAAVGEIGPVERVVAFFPREGAWTFVETPDRPTLVPRVGRRRFGPEHTADALRLELCGTLGLAARLSVDQDGEPLPWRYVGGNRFVPAGAGRRSLSYVQWRAERGTWVVDELGEEVEYSPHVRGDLGWPVLHTDTVGRVLLPPARRFAAGQPWYLRHQPLRTPWGSLTKYGLPREIGAGEVVRIGWIQGVPAFAEAGASPPFEVVYVLVTASEYQPYQNTVNTTCPFGS